MGNYSSIIKNKNDEKPLNFKQLNSNNTEFLDKLNEVATNYILGQNFQDMIRLTNSKYCDDLVIITSKILKKSFFSTQIQVIYKKTLEGDKYANVGEATDVSENVSKEQTKRMCIEIAKYYVKVAHLFAAIITTLNPVFSWRSSASSSRAILSPHIPTSNDELENDMKDLGIEPQLGDGIEKTTLENKHYISDMAKNVKVENLNFCNSRISDLIDMDEVTDLFNSEHDIQDPNHVSEIRIKTKLCSSSLNNIGNTDTSTRQVKTVYDLPGFAELTRLYNDKYNTSKGRFDRMSAKSKEEKKRNVDLLYTLFTGDISPPKDIKNFRDIPLHSFSDSIDCEGVNSMLNKTYIGTTKDKLFVDYVEQVKKMIYDSNMIRNSLLEIIDKVFISNVDVGVDMATDDVSREHRDDNASESKRMKYMIDPDLTYEELNELIAETRKIILKLYVNCEKNFIYTLKILQAIIEAQIFETGQRQIKELERSIDNEY
jgi:hypothetical protein